MCFPTGMHGEKLAIEEGVALPIAPRSSFWPNRLNALSDAWRRSSTETRTSKRPFHMVPNDYLLAQTATGGPHSRACFFVSLLNVQRSPFGTQLPSSIAIHWLFGEAQRFRARCLPVLPAVSSFPQPDTPLWAVTPSESTHPIASGSRGLP